VVASDVTKRILSSYEAGDLITMCAWCRRVEFDGEWLIAPHVALTAIDSRYTLSHTICPDCGTKPASRPTALV
jgi:ribosomal protein L32